MLRSRLASTPWFTILTEEQQQHVIDETLLQHYPAGAFVVRKGDPSRHWIGVIEGLVRISVGTADGKLAALTGVPPGGWVGEGALLKAELRRYDLVTLRDSVIAKMPIETFHWLLDNSIAFNRFLLDQFNHRMGQFIGRIESDRLFNADIRVARCIAELVRMPNYADDNYNRQLNITQEEIGYLARVSRQRTNGALKKLAEAGLIELQYRSVLINDLVALETLEEI
ncbi:MAG: Crp/Fnr family transcriptional regulator [Alcaligenaceae bacterium]|jgi:CRP-like cAMP-binding protein|nr:Crp/Fnr family transcriptional regulator [Alcaligenaceae bacterium]